MEIIKELDRTYFSGIITEENFKDRNLFDILQFGSNTQGRHGAGTALMAKLHRGAIYGQAFGLQGDAFGIITKDISVRPYKSHPVNLITKQIYEFYQYTITVPDKRILVPYSAEGTNLNFYTPYQMAWMYKQIGIFMGYIPNNIIFEDKFFKLMDKVQ